MLPDLLFNYTEPFPQVTSCSECVSGAALRYGPVLCKGDCTWNEGKCKAKSTKENPSLTSCQGPDCNQRPAACLGPTCGSLPTTPTSCIVGQGCHSDHPEHPEHPKHPEDPEDPEPVDGSWSGWSWWGECSQSCGKGGSRTRTRKCSPPSAGGRACQGPTAEREACLHEPCSGRSK